MTVLMCKHCILQPLKPGRHRENRTLAPSCTGNAHGRLFQQGLATVLFFEGTVRDADIKVVTQKKANVPAGAAIVAVTVGAIMNTDG